MMASLAKRLSRFLETANLTFGLTEAAIMALAGSIIAIAVAYGHMR